MGILTVENVTKNYTGHRALDNVSLDVPEGSVYGLLGPNGAGKTSLIRIINHITMPDSGRVYFRGREMTQQDVNCIGYLPEERGLYKKMRVGDQALYFAMLKGLDKKMAIERLREWFIRFEITDWWNKKVEELSKGMAQKIQFIVTVLHQPPLLILDEPFSGFDPINADIIRKEILRMRDNGTTIIFSTHNMSSVEEMCDHITLINRSHNILSGSVVDVKNKYGEKKTKIIYEGDDNTVREALSVNGLDYSSEPETVITIDNNDLKGIIGIINSHASIKSVNEIVPTMNDIFIRAVRESEKNE